MKQSKHSKLKSALKHHYHKGINNGEGNIISLMTQLKKDHTRQLATLMAAHKKEIILIENEYTNKTSILDKKIKQVADAAREWENKLQDIIKTSAKTHQIAATVKESFLQGVKKHEFVKVEVEHLEHMDKELAKELKKPSSKPKLPVDGKINGSRKVLEKTTLASLIP